LQDPSNAQNFKNLGINTFVGLWQGPTASQIQALQQAQMPVMAEQNSTGLSLPGTLTGWTQVDEPDNAQWNGSGYDPCVNPTIIQNNYNQMVANDSTRPVYLNFGQGVSWENWFGRGTCTGNLSMYPQYMAGADIVSFDIYPVNATDPLIAGNLWYVAQGVERLVNWNNQYFNGSKIVWNDIEASNIEGTGLPTTAQIRTEVWMSIISGSMGIVYFVHEFNPFYEAAILVRQEPAYQALRAGITGINAQVTQLAPVLNSPTLTQGTTVVSSNAAVPIKTMTKQYANSVYVFAVAMRDGATQGNFTLNNLTAQSTTVEVIGENRSIPLLGNGFSDPFGGYQVHLYRIGL